MKVCKKKKDTVVYKKSKGFDFEFWLDGLPTWIKCILYFTIELLMGFVYTLYMRYTTTDKNLYYSTFWDCTYCFLSVAMTRFGLRGLSFFTQCILYTLSSGIGHIIGMIVLQ